MNQIDWIESAFADGLSEQDLIKIRDDAKEHHTNVSSAIKALSCYDLILPMFSTIQQHHASIDGSGESNGG